MCLSEVALEIPSYPASGAGGMLSGREFLELKHC